MRLGICLKAVSKTASPFMSGELKRIFNGIGLNRIKWFSVINALNASELGVSTAYSLHPLLYGYVVKFISLSLDE